MKSSNFIVLYIFTIFIFLFHNNILFSQNSQSVILFNAGVESEQSEKYDQAVAYFSLAITLEPNYYDAFYHRGIVYRKLKNYYRAIMDNTKLLMLKNTSENYINRAKVYIEMKEYNSAVNDLNKALDLDSNSYAAYYNRANVYYSKIEYDSSLADLQKCIAIYPGYKDALDKLALLQKDKGDKQNSQNEIAEHQHNNDVKSLDRFKDIDLHKEPLKQISDTNSITENNNTVSEIKQEIKDSIPVSEIKLEIKQPDTQIDKPELPQISENIIQEKSTNNEITKEPEKQIVSDNKVDSKQRFPVSEIKEEIKQPVTQIDKTEQPLISENTISDKSANNEVNKEPEKQIVDTNSIAENNIPVVVNKEEVNQPIIPIDKPELPQISENIVQEKLNNNVITKEPEKQITDTNSIAENNIPVVVNKEEINQPIIPIDKPEPTQISENTISDKSANNEVIKEPEKQIVDTNSITDNNIPVDVNKEEINQPIIPIDKPQLPQITENSNNEKLINNDVSKEPEKQIADTNSIAENNIPVVVNKEEINQPTIPIDKPQLPQITENSNNEKLINNDVSKEPEKQIADTNSIADKNIHVVVNKEESNQPIIPIDKPELPQISENIVKEKSNSNDVTKEPEKQIVDTNSIADNNKVDTPVNEIKEDIKQPIAQIDKPEPLQISDKTNNEKPLNIEVTKESEKQIADTNSIADNKVDTPVSEIKQTIEQPIAQIDKPELPQISENANNETTKEPDKQIVDTNSIAENNKVEAPVIEIKEQPIIQIDKPELPQISENIIQEKSTNNDVIKEPEKQITDTNSIADNNKVDVPVTEIIEDIKQPITQIDKPELPLISENSNNEKPINNEITKEPEKQIVDTNSIAENNIPVVNKEEINQPIIPIDKPKLPPISENISTAETTELQTNDNNKTELSSNVVTPDLSKNENNKTIAEKNIETVPKSEASEETKENTNNKSYAIQLGAFVNEVNAKEFTKKVKNLIEYDVNSYQVSGLTKVRVGNYPLNEAIEVIKKIRDSGFTDAFIVDASK